MDQIYCCRYPWIFHFHYAIPSGLLHRCSCNRFLNRIPQHRTSIMDRCCLLFHAHPRTNSMPGAWLRMEIVGTNYFVSEEVWLALAAIEEHIDQHRIISHRSFKSTIYPIIDLGKNSKWYPFRQSILPEHFLRRFQKAIKKVRAVQRMRRNRGFAFSQTENAGRQDQAKLIRAYDTSKSNARPTGY